VPPTRQAVDEWLVAYVRAWQRYDPADIGNLFTEDATWWQPFGVRAQGRDRIVAEWMAEQHLDEPGGYGGRYECIAVDGDLAVCHGRTEFVDPTSGERRGRFDNLWVLRFGPDGRCAEFHEWYAPEPVPAGDAAPPGAESPRRDSNP
jgi:uncharacterized protein (TIGR02246 family)